MSKHRPLLRPGFYCLIHTTILPPLGRSDMLPAERDVYLAHLPARWHYYPTLEYFDAPTVCRAVVEMKEYIHEQ